MTPPPLASILEHLRSEPSRTGSIVITVFGDAVVPRGGSLWLGSLLEVFAGMGIGGGAVRTAMSRLAGDDWLRRNRIGRNSFYRLTDKGQASSIVAARRIYGEPCRAWDGQFHLLLEHGGADREAARGALQHAGFGVMAPGVWVAAHSGPVPPEALGFMRMQGTADAGTGREIAARAWPLSATIEAYGRFLEAFAPLHRHATSGGALVGLEALVGRILLVHEYRRIALRDPGLPLALLPEDWPGTMARLLCADVYRALLGESELWLDRHGRDENGPLPQPGADLRRRFDSSSHVTEFS